MTPQNDPMPLENLPDYLNSRKAANLGSPVVNMGQIIVPKKEPNWSQRMVLATLMFVVLGVGGLATYDLMSTEQMTVVVDIDSGVDPSLIPKIVSDSGGEALSVTHTEDSTYEVTVETRKSRSSFLEWLRRNRDVIKAELEE
jgi:hypothetical protein